MKHKLVLLDSIALIDASADGQVVVSGSHGGASAAGFVLALQVKPLVVFYNDAGVGKANAGILALEMLGAIGLACATYSHQSACIGNAKDGLDNGVITHANQAALSMGIRTGDRVNTLVDQLTQ